MNKNRLIITLCAIAGFVLTTPALAVEQIDNYEVVINVGQDAGLTVTERIDYDFGEEQKHGIFRDLPYEYRARGGKYRLEISDITATDQNGQAVAFETERKGELLSIKIGSADRFVSGKNSYIISYTAGRAINYFGDNDELYWNAIGNAWNVLIEKAKITVNLPDSVNADQVRTECFTGVVGGTDPCVSTRFLYSGEDSVNGFVFSNDRLHPGEGLTLAVSWPKGVVAEPTFLQNLWSAVKDNWILALPLVVFAVLFWLWRTRGRDPRGRGTLITEFDAPKGLTPIEVGLLVDDKVQTKDLIAEIVYLAVRGRIKIVRHDGKGIFKKTDYELMKLAGGQDVANPVSEKMMEALFPAGKSSLKLSELKPKTFRVPDEDIPRKLSEVRDVAYEQIKTKGYYATNPNKIRNIFVFTGLVVMMSSMFLMTVFGLYGIISTAVSGALIIVFGYFMPARTKAGVQALEHILGFKRYLNVAEKDRLEFHNAPEKNFEHFEKLLPFAIALGVDKQWTKQFDGIIRQPSWYDGGTAGFTSHDLAIGLGGFSSGFKTAISSSAAGGGSGFSGGGVGGGFGGGGGGSW